MKDFELCLVLGQTEQCQLMSENPVACSQFSQLKHTK